MELTTKVDIKDLDKVFLGLPRATQRKAIVPAMRESMKVIQKKAIANVKAIVSDESTGVLERNVRVYTLKKYRGNFRVAVHVKRGAVNTKSGKNVRVGLYASVLEYGKKGQPPRSWIRKAIREGQQESVSKLAQEINRRVPEAIKDAKR